MIRYFKDYKRLATLIADQNSRLVELGLQIKMLESQLAISSKAKTKEPIGPLVAIPYDPYSSEVN